MRNLNNSKLLNKPALTIPPQQHSPALLRPLQLSSIKDLLQVPHLIIQLQLILPQKVMYPSRLTEGILDDLVVFGVVDLEAGGRLGLGVAGQGDYLLYVAVRVVHDGEAPGEHLF
jgi:hypothetical protein